MKRKEKWNKGAITKEEKWQPPQQYSHKEISEKEEIEKNKDWDPIAYV